MGTVSYLNTLPGLFKLGEIIFCLLCMFCLSINDEAKLGFYWTDNGKTLTLFIACIFGVVLSTLIVILVSVRAEERGFVKWMCLAWHALFIALCVFGGLLILSEKGIIVISASFGFIAGFIYFLDGCYNCILVKGMKCYPGCRGRSSSRHSSRPPQRSSRKPCCF